MFLGNCSTNNSSTNNTRVVATVDLSQIDDQDDQIKPVAPKPLPSLSSVLPPPTLVPTNANLVNKLIEQS